MGAADDVFTGQQHLADGAGVAGEARRVTLRQEQLSDAGAGLQGGQIARSLGKPQRCDPRGDGTTGDEHDVALFDGQRVDEGVDPGGVQPVVGGGQ